MPPAGSPRPGRFGHAAGTGTWSPPASRSRDELLEGPVPDLLRRADVVDLAVGLEAGDALAGQRLADERRRPALRRARLGERVPELAEVVGVDPPRCPA